MYPVTLSLVAISAGHLSRAWCSVSASSLHSGHRAASHFLLHAFSLYAPIGSSRLLMISAPCMRSLCTLAGMHYQPYNRTRRFTVSTSHSWSVSISEDVDIAARNTANLLEQFLAASRHLTQLHVIECANLSPTEAECTSANRHNRYQSSQILINAFSRLGARCALRPDKRWTTGAPALKACNFLSNGTKFMLQITLVADCRWCRPVVAAPLSHCEPIGVTSLDSFGSV